MSKRVSLTEKLEEDKKKKESPRDSLFNSTAQVETKSEVKNISKKEPDSFKRQTYYMSEELIDALMIYKAFEDKDISVIVREALYEYIPEEYLQRAREKKK